MTDRVRAQLKEAWDVLRGQQKPPSYEEIAMEDQLRLVKEENVRLKRDKQVLQQELLSLRGVESSQELVEENVELQRE